MTSQSGFSLRPFMAIILLAIVIDLASKLLWTTHAELSSDVYFNPNKLFPGARVLVCAITVAFLALYTKIGESRGFGPVRWVWFTSGVLIGGIIAQEISTVIWHKGVPDFIWNDPYVLNIADTMIFFGALSTFVALLAYPMRAYFRSRSS